MKIALLGGTGSIGQGFALRLSRENEVVVGSRTAEKAEAGAQEYLERMEECGFDISGIRISGSDNLDAANKCDIVILTLPYGCVSQVIEAVHKALEEKVVVTPVVPMEKMDGCMQYRPPEQGSAALAIKEMVPDSARVVAAYHTIPACKLRDVEHEFKYDTVICSDDDEAKKTVFGIAHQMGCMRPLDGGPLSTSNMAESMTPLLLNLAKMNGLKDLGVNFS